jgi:beta-xylosidase
LLLRLEGDISPIHDPSIIRQGSGYYLFSTIKAGDKLVPMRCSEDLLRWTLCGSVLRPGVVRGIRPCSPTGRATCSSSTPTTV